MTVPTTIFPAAASVLIIKPRAIGDVLLSTPVIRNLKRAAPHLEIDFLTERFAADVVRGNPAVREVLTFSKKDDTSLSVIRTVRKRRYDVVIDLFGNPRTALITRFSGAGTRIGFPFRGRAYAYTHLVTPRGGEVHNVDFNLDVLRHFGIPIEPGMPEFPLAKEHHTFAEQWLREQGLFGKKLLGVNASGGWYTKKWNPKGFAALTDRIAKNDGLTPLLFWGPGEEKDVRAIAAMMTTPAVLIPPTSLKQMGAFLTACSYLVSNDSGPMHIAAALGVPTLGIFGPTSPQLQGPYGSINRVVRHDGLDCLECNLTECPIGNLCMKDLAVEKVYSAFQQLLQSQC
ncbi:MAG: glycosyltransferase family 9 protein [Bacteroidetes bacterium]|nr:glycosyltransferase family 9 protein [Bacteroidota bacterium]